MGKGKVAAPRKQASDGSASQTQNGNGRKPVDTITLPDGTKMPVGIPPGLDPTLAKQVIEYLKKNPEHAKQTYEQAQRMMQNPAVAQGMLQAQTQMANPEYAKQMEVLKDDPDLKPIFEDIAANGPSAMQKYWNDKDLMSKISAKMGSMSVSKQPGTTAPKPKFAITNLHDAAKAGDVEAVLRYLEEGSDPDEKDARGITPLGVAVGFNKVEVIKALLERKADVSLTDARGNTALHYAAGYGRKEAAELLLDAGASAEARNVDGQLPTDVAEVNHELHMVTFLEQKLGKSFSGSKYL